MRQHENLEAAPACVDHSSVREICAVAELDEARKVQLHRGFISSARIRIDVPPSTRVALPRRRGVIPSVEPVRLHGHWRK
jgi:hypothetical protein